MLNLSKEWKFVREWSALSDREVHFWKQALHKNLKVGVEIELNLPEQIGSCDRQNFLCQCIAIFKPEDKLPNTDYCYEQCQRWDNGNCEIAKAEGCAGVHCAAFKQPCPSCSKYDRGCDSCPELYDLKRDPRYVREALGKVLSPTRFVGEHGKNGIYKVCKDGSLTGDGGVEIATVGRRVQFEPIYEMIDNIMRLSAKHGAFVNERCSIHIHLLASYLTPTFSNSDKANEYLINEITELEKSMPEIILANFHQLVRRYHCALIWLSAAGDSPDHLTRWEKFRKSILPYSAERNRMPTVVKSVGSASNNKRKYAMMNYEQIKFDENGDVARLHVEGRYMDGNMSPATVTAHCCLLYGLMLKAVEISRYGLLISGNKHYMELQKEMYKNLCNNDGEWGGPRKSDTSRIGPYVEEISKQARQLVRLVKSTLSEQQPADDILRNLANQPLAHRIIAGDSWETIEKSLLPGLQEPTSLQRQLVRVVDLGVITECDSMVEWVEAATEQLAQEKEICEQPKQVEELKESIQNYVNKLEQDQNIFWSSAIGGFIRSR